jgi:hypothetical protein
VTTALERGEHGVTAWRQGCRCPTCRRALHRRAQVWWATAQVRRGREPASHVPADKVRRHIAELRAAGWTSSSIARAAQVAPATITRIRKPTTKRCSRIVAGAILALP